MGDSTVHGEAIEADHFNSLEMLRRGLDLSDALINAKSGLFAGVGKHCNDHFAKEIAGPFNQIEVPVGQRVETAGIEGPHRG